MPAQILPAPVRPTTPLKRKRSRPAANSPASAADVPAPAPSAVPAPSVPAPADDVTDVTAAGSVFTVPAAAAPERENRMTATWGKLGSTKAELKKNDLDLKKFPEEQNAQVLPQAI